MVKPRGMVGAMVMSALLALGAAGAAQAGNATPKARVLTSADITASLGRPFSSEFSKKPIDDVKNVTLCTDNKGGPLVFVPAPKRQYSSKIVMKPQRKVFSSVNERVFVYPSVDAASAAYAQLSSEVSKCTGVVAGPAHEDPKVTDTFANGSSPGGAYQNFWVQDSTVFDSTRPLENDKTVTYAVFSQAGNAVIHTELYVDGRTEVTLAQKNDLQQLSMTLSARWAPQ